MPKVNGMRESYNPQQTIRQFMSMPHPPCPQKSEPHIPLPHAAESTLSLDLPDCAANVEYCVVRWS
jgi:hypothetical protein